MQKINFRLIDNNDKYQHIYIAGDINDQIFDLDKKKDGIVFHINSNGGDAFTAQNLMQRLMRYKKEKIMLSYGTVRSGAFTIFAFGDVRYGSKFDNYLIHGGSLTGTTSIKTSKFLLNTTQDFFVIMSKRLTKISNKPFNFWLDLFTNGSDNYFTGKEMKKFGIIKYY